MGNFSKLIGSIVGAIFGILIAKFGLPESIAGPEIQAAVTVLLSGAATWAFPANKPA